MPEISPSFMHNHKCTVLFPCKSSWHLGHYLPNDNRCGALLDSPPNFGRAEPISGIHYAWAYTPNFLVQITVAHCKRRRISGHNRPYVPFENIIFPCSFSHYLIVSCSHCPSLQEHLKANNMKIKLFLYYPLMSALTTKAPPDISRMRF